MLIYTFSFSRGVDTFKGIDNMIYFYQLKCQFTFCYSFSFRKGFE